MSFWDDLGSAFSALAPGVGSGETPGQAPSPPKVPLSTRAQNYYAASVMNPRNEFYQKLYALRGATNIPPSAISTIFTEEALAGNRDYMPGGEVYELARRVKVYDDWLYPWVERCSLVARSPKDFSGLQKLLDDLQVSTIDIEAPGFLGFGGDASWDQLSSLERSLEAETLALSRMGVTAPDDAPPNQVPSQAPPDEALWELILKYGAYVLIGGAVVFLAYTYLRGRK